MFVSVKIVAKIETKSPGERETMNNQFDEHTNGIAQSVTRRTALKQFGVGLAGLALARFGLNQAQAITNGQLDGNAHPNVGAGVFLKSLWPPIPAPLVCGSGTLIHPRVLLTAGHATYLLESAMADGSFGLSDFRLSFASNALDSNSWLDVSAVLTHPDFAAGVQTELGRGDVPLADVGVVILRDAVDGILPEPLPPLGFLDALQAAGKLRSGSDQAKLTVVGFGVELGQTPGQTPFPPDGLRRVAQSDFLNLHDRWLYLDQNVAQGKGGTADCDSGGPAFWVDPITRKQTLVAITSRGGSVVSVGVDYRVDTAEALSFLNQVLQLVNAGKL